MNRSTAALVAVLLALIAGATSYHVGRGRGFDQGWDKGYIRGLENFENSDTYQKGFADGCTNAQNASPGNDDEILSRCMESKN